MIVLHRRTELEHCYRLDISSLEIIDIHMTTILDAEDKVLVDLHTLLRSLVAHLRDKDFSLNILDRIDIQLSTASERQ